ncbi:MAG: FecR domain-containing protein [Deltaproteobacteria bacterium]|nr:FecR domain-containing protein [Deltaproteobacteria bacterium]MBW2154349.1 FecR domain-containing protein [Deltaproteobacteria bacterium]
MTRKFILVACICLFVVGPVFSQQPTRPSIGPEVELPEELRQLVIYEEFIPCDEEQIGIIQTVLGHVVVFHGDNNLAFIAASGDPLYKRDVVFTLADSRCRIRFSTEDLITLGENTRIGIERFVDDETRGEKSSIISMLRGKAMFYVFRLFKYGKIDSSVNTPTAIIGVRGTKFGTEVRPSGESRAQTQPGYLTDASATDHLVQLPKESRETETIVHCFEGTLDVFSTADRVTQLVMKGQSLEVTSLGAGDIQITPPEVARQFMLDTEVPEPGGEAANEDASSGPEASSESSEGKKQQAEATGLETQEQTDTTTAFATQDAIQTQTVQRVEDQAAAKGDAIGYITAMLTRLSGDEKVFHHLYISDESQDFRPGAVVRAKDKLGRGEIDTPLLLEGEGTKDEKEEPETDKTPQLKTVEISYNNKRETINGPFKVIEQMLQKDEFMEWGYWTQPQAMASSSGTNFLIDNRGYYISGKVTTEVEMSALQANQIKGEYRGGAYGTYWTDTGGINMEGSFSAQVDFGQKLISDFNVSVSGQGHNVTIKGAEGVFSGQTSQFAINPATPGSVWQIDGMDAHPAAKEAYGSIYGPNGEKMGGVWKLDTPLGEGEAHATGIFEGSR